MSQKRDPRHLSEDTRLVVALADWMFETIMRIRKAQEKDAPFMQERARQRGLEENADSEPV